ncbi:MAG: hypothetical protein JXA30_20680 [Deltaproteobacteria bacterium]|nr:hypothetical protein [Deltaproteobacteria bacterium]
MRPAFCYLFLLALLAPARVFAGSSSECFWDEALSRAAASLVSKGARPDSEVLLQAARDAGSDAVGLHALWLLEFDDEAVNRWLRKIGTTADAPLACGDARDHKSRLVIAAARAGSLAAFDSQSRVIRGWLSPTFTDPELVVSFNSGEIRRYRIHPNMLETGITLAADLPAPIIVQLVAHGPAGPRPVAQRVVTFGDGKPSARETARREQSNVVLTTDEATGESTAVSTAQELSIQINRIRAKRTMPALRSNRLIDTAATEHAQSVCNSGRIGHQLRLGDDPETRLARQGVRARLVGEAIARSTDPGAAWRALLRSPSHLSTLLDGRFTDAGIGLARDPGGRSCLIVMLAAWPRFVGR